MTQLICLKDFFLVLMAVESNSARRKVKLFTLNFPYLFHYCSKCPFAMICNFVLRVSCIFLLLYCSMYNYLPRVFTLTLFNIFSSIHMMYPIVYSTNFGYKNVILENLLVILSAIHCSSRPGHQLE